MKEWIKKAKKASRQGDYIQAGDFYYLAGDIDKALQMYLRGEHYDFAAKLCEKIDELEDAAELYCEAKDYSAAADCYHRLRKYKEASLMYQRGRDFYKAAEMSQKAGNLLRAAQMLERTSYQNEAAALYIKIGDNLKAAEIMEKLYLAYDKQLQSHKELTSKEEEYMQEYGKLCADQFFRAGRYDKSAHYYEQIGLYEKAGKAYSLAKQPKKELECLIKERSYSKALQLIKQNPSLKIGLLLVGELYQGVGEYEKAAKSFLKAGKKEKAADCLQLGGNYQQAAELWEEMRNYFRAAELYIKAKNKKKAALMYEKEGDFLSAAKLCEERGEFSKAAELYEEAKEYMRAADIYNELKNIENYIQTLQKVPEDSSHYKKASFLLGKAFKEKGLFSIAEKKLLKAIEGVDVNKESIEPYYLLALVYEELEQVDKAKEVFEKLISFDYKYKDVAERIEKLKKWRAIRDTQPLNDEWVKNIRAKSGAVIAGRYKVKEEIGRGGMGKVLLVHDTKLDELIALKLLIPYLDLVGNEEQVKRFIQEIKITRKINHPNVIRVFDIGEWHGNHFITMEYIDGGNLNDWMRNNPKNMNGRISLVLQICAGLNAAHRLDIVHRDIKPENILIDKGKIAKIVDFGIARALSIGTRTVDGKIIGTPDYMSPEQIEGGILDQGSDIYSLGVLIYYLFTWKMPFVAPNVGQVLLKHLYEMPIPPSDLNPQIPSWVDKIILKSMEKHPAERYQSTMEIIKEIKARWHPKT